MKYRKKPIIVEAIQYTGDNLLEVMKFCGEGKTLFDYCLYIVTLEGNMRANKGDYIIKGVHGEFYPCKPDIFKETYETVSMVSDNDKTTVPMSEYRKLENKNKKLRNTINRLKRELEVED